MTIIVDGSKTTSIRDIPTNMLKQAIHIHLPKITQIIDVSIDKECYPDDLNLAEVCPVFKTKDDLDKEKYRPVSVFSQASKVFEKLLPLSKIS